MVDMEDEEEKLLKEGELMESLVNVGDKIGYDENDYVVERHELPNCIHEYVAPATYVRPEYKKPAVRAKEYKFTLDKF